MEAGTVGGHSQSQEAGAAAVEDEMAELCGTLNVTAGRLVALIASALETGACEGTGIHSPAQWVAWKCGVSSARARRLVAMARRRTELAETMAALEAGELSEDQAAVVARLAPAYADAEVATLARNTTVSQLSRTLRRYTWPAKPGKENTGEEDTGEQDTKDSGAEDSESGEARRVSFGTTEEGAWRLSALLPPDEAALVERAMEAARLGLIDDTGADHPSWADAFVAMAERSLGADAATRPYRDRHLVILHLSGDEHGTAAHLHAGPPMPDALRRLLGCDARLRPLAEVAGVALSVGRTLRIVPDRTRMAVEDRDGACRVPGCERSRRLQVHHIVHWEDGGATDTANLLALCARHHRLHHMGKLGITGDADHPDGVEFSDAKGRRITGCGRPAPPRGDPPTGSWSHPSGERLDPRWIHFNEPRPAA